MNKEIIETFNEMQTKINHFQAGVHKMNIKEAARRSQIIEYHYKEIIHSLQQINYHMEQIEQHCQVPPAPQKPPRLYSQPPQERIVKNRIRQFDTPGKSQLSPTFLEHDLKEFRSVQNLFQNNKPLTTRPKSMENLSRKELSVAACDGDKKLSLEHLPIGDAKSKQLRAFDQGKEDASSSKPKVVALHPKKGGRVD